MKHLCLSYLHLRSEAVVATIDRKHLSPFLVQIATTITEVSLDAATEDEFLLYGNTPLSGVKSPSDFEVNFQPEFAKTYAYHFSISAKGNKKSRKKMSGVGLRLAFRPLRM